MISQTEAHVIATKLVDMANFVTNLETGSVFTQAAAKFALLELAESLLIGTGLPLSACLIEYSQEDNRWQVPPLGAGVPSAQS